MLSVSSVVMQTCWFYGLYYVCDYLSIRQRPRFDLTFYVLIHFNFLTLMSLTWYHSWIYDNNKMTENPLTFIVKLGLSFVWAEVWSWTCHRLFHTRLLYKYIHSIHHKYRKPSSFTTLYCHPIENICFNLGILLGGIHLLQMSTFLTHVYTAIVSFFAVTSHSGQIQWFSYTYFSKHDWHHLYMDCEYGLDLFMDSIMGTKNYHVKNTKKLLSCQDLVIQEMKKRIVSEQNDCKKVDQITIDSTST